MFGPGLFTALPNFDQCEAAGLDGTLRGLDGRDPGEPITWAELATIATDVLGELVGCGILTQEQVNLARRVVTEG